MTSTRFLPKEDTDSNNISLAVLKYSLDFLRRLDFLSRALAVSSILSVSTFLSNPSLLPVNVDKKSEADSPKSSKNFKISAEPPVIVLTNEANKSVTIIDFE